MSRRGSAAVLTLFALALVPGVANAAELPKTGRLLVTLKQQPAAETEPKAKAAVATAVVARSGARLALPTVPEIGLAVVKPAPGQSLAELARELRDDPAVETVRAERRFKLRYTPNDFALTSQLPGAPAGITEEWWALSTGFFDGWDQTRGPAATIAILDTGIDGTHPEFEGKIKRTVDLDRIKGHGGARTDEVGHGTHVASLACARGDNHYGIVGSGFNCKLLVAKTDLSEGSVAAAIVWAVKHHADAVNMSFGTDSGEAASPEIKQAIEYANRRDVIMVAAAADEPRSDQGDPANLLQPTGTGRLMNSNKIRGLTVTAATAQDQRAPFAGRGSQISLAAYGSYGPGSESPGMLGAFPANETEIERGSFEPPGSAPCGCRAVLNGDNRFARMQGTSMAAPLVSGIVGSMRALNPDLTSRQVIRIVKKTARRSGGWSPELGWGILDAAKALSTTRNTDARAPRSKITFQKGKGKVRLAWNGKDSGPSRVRVSGVRYYDVYRYVPGGKPIRIKRTKRGYVTVDAAPGTGFYTVAVDNAGNREKAPSKPDLIIR
ncbi:MAG TPA: S8 family serine peptidase [Baekduia sp.]|nr:S8 family serine peptidase [Baekduia sp.]